MKKIIIILLCCITAVMAQAQGKNWCETLVNSLNASEDVDKTIAVKRDPSTHEITNATYDYRFSSDNLYKKIANNMKSHSADADYYTEKGKKLKTIILRFNDRGRRWSCKLQCLDKKGKQFLVTVSSNEQSSVETDTKSLQEYKERQRQLLQQSKELQRQGKERQQEELIKQSRERTKELQRQAKKRQRQAVERQRQAKKRQRQAVERQNQAKERQRQAVERQRQAMERQRRAVERQRQAVERQRQAVERQRSAAERQRQAVKATSGTYIITEYDKEALEQHNNELKKAEQERKRKLGL